MKLDRKLNMVLPLEYEGVTYYVHSTPIDRSIFEAYFEPIARAFTVIYAGGHGVYSGPRVALLILRKVATGLGVWDGENGVEQNLLVEIRRLTNVAMPGPNGWSYVPWEVAVKDNLIDEDDIGEVENAIVFFTLASAMHKKAELRQQLEPALSLWGARVESLPLTGFLASLATSTEIVDTGEKKTATPSSIPV
jgi:hypothetical protein